MFLPNFDLTQLIKAFNQRNEKNIQNTENFGYPYLAASMLSNCNQLIDAINDAADLFYFSEQETEILKQRSIKVKTWRRTANNSHDSMRQYFNGFKQAYELPQALAAKRQLFDWRRQYHSALGNTDNWINLVDRLMPLSEFHPLKVEWKKREAFARHSVQCIAVIATKWLPDLIAHHKRALDALKWHYFSMPSTIYVAYRKYLASFLHHAKQLQHTLADAMCDRLQVFIDTQLTHADVVVNTAQKLNIKCPTPTEQLTAQQFVQFGHYIQKHGLSDTKMRWNSLNCFSNSVFPLQVIGNKANKTVVPKSLAAAVPEKLKKPAWLFQGANLRYTVCEQHLLDFMALQQLPDVTHVEFDIKTIQTVTNLLATLQDKQQLTNKLLDELRQPPYSNLSRWHWRTHHFLKKYQVLLCDYQQKTIAAQLTMAEKIAATLLQSEETVELALKIPLEASQLLRNLLQDLQATIDDSNHLPFKNRLQQLKSQCHAALALNRVAHLIKTAAEGQIIRADDLDYIKTVLNNTATINNPAWQQFTHQSSRNLLQNLLNELKRNPAAITKQEQQLAHYAKIRQACGILQLLAPKYDAHSISNPLTQYFLYYLNAILRCGNEAKDFAKHEPLLDLFESVIELFPKAHEIFIGHLSIAQCLDNFNKLRKQNDWIEIQAEAESLAFTLGEQLLIDRVDKACNRLDAQIKDLITQKMKPSAHSPLTGTLVFQVRDQLTQKNKHNVDSEIMDSLSTHEQVMLGMKQSCDDRDTRDFIPALIEFSSQAQQLQKVVRDDQVSYSTKFEQVFAFQAAFDKALSEFKQAHGVTESFGLSKKSSALFFKPYTALSVPILENDISSNANNTFLAFHHGK